MYCSNNETLSLGSKERSAVSGVAWEIEGTDVVWDKRLRSQLGAPQSGRPLPFSPWLFPSPLPRAHRHASSYLLSPLPHAKSVRSSGYDWCRNGAMFLAKEALAQGHGEVLRGGRAGASWKGRRACQTHAGADVSSRNRAGPRPALCC